MTPEELAQQYQNMDFDYFIESALERVPESLDTREGSVIYDAIAPAAYLMTEMALNLSTSVLNTFTQTASGEFLDYRAEERGITREPATYAELVATMTDENGSPLVGSLGDRFASVGVEPVYYSVKRLSNITGQVILAAETAGEVGNSYVGQILPVSPISSFGNAEIIEVSIPARDQESDDELRERLLKTNEIISFGGNVSDYINYVNEMDEVAAVQVYPTWNGGGTVKIVILNNQYLTPSQALISKVQTVIDPVDVSGNGYGIAPIGHKVTVMSPTLRTINVSVTIQTANNVTAEDVRQQIEKAISDYFADVRKSWGVIDFDTRTYLVTLYRSQIIVSLLKINGITNVSNVSFDGTEGDVNLITNDKKEELAMLGTVKINE